MRDSSVWDLLIVIFSTTVGPSIVIAIKARYDRRRHTELTQRVDEVQKEVRSPNGGTTAQSVDIIKKEVRALKVTMDEMRGEVDDIKGTVNDHAADMIGIAQQVGLLSQTDRNPSSRTRSGDPRKKP